MFAAIDLVHKTLSYAEFHHARTPYVTLVMGALIASLVMAQRGYQASVGVTKNAQDTYSSALQIGRG